MSVKVIKIKILRVSTHKIQIIILHLGKAQSYFLPTTINHNLN